MLKDEIKDKKTEETEGECKFCRQMMAIKALPEWDQDKKNELATELCNCTDARVYAERKKRQEKAEAIIVKTFKNTPKMQITDPAIETLKRGVACMIQCEFDTLQLKCGAVTATITKPAPGKILIKGSRKEEAGGEVE